MSSEARRQIVFVTGSRAEYGLQAPIVEEIQGMERVDAGFLVTGSHLSPFHGRTVDEIRAEGLPIWGEVPSLLAADSLGARPRTLGLLIGHVVSFIETRKPDMVVACGDREDVLAAAIASIYTNTIFCHYAAGDEAFDGNVDNAVRHAASKLAHLLLVMYPAHRDLLVRCGEDPWRIHVVGNAALDRILATPEICDEELEALLPYPLPDGPMALVIHHPTTLTVDSVAHELEEILAAVEESGLVPVVSYPNTDAGNAAMRAILDNRQKESSPVRVHHNLDRLAFVNLARRARVLVGNSSMGLLEAPTLRLPVVNVGLRQGRRLGGDHVVYCDPERRSIRGAIERASSPEFRSGIDWRNPYGDGRSARRIAELLSEIDLNNEELRFKCFTTLQEDIVP